MESLRARPSFRAFPIILDVLPRCICSVVLEGVLTGSRDRGSPITLFRETPFAPVPANGSEAEFFHRVPYDVRSSMRIAWPCSPSFLDLSSSGIFQLARNSRSKCSDHQGVSCHLKYPDGHWINFRNNERSD